MQRIQLFSPAKLNLFLHITGRRPDGYHQLQTLFQLLDYGDDLIFTPRNDGKLLLSPTLAGVKTQDNLIIKAARLLQQHSQTHKGANIQLNKRLPMGGGLGGGSSNAATTLVGLNALWGTQLSIETLATLGLQLGADVPVFVHGDTAWGSGIGEILQPLTLPERWYLVIKPCCTVSTTTIFSHQQLTRNTTAITVAAFFEQGGGNDCEDVVCQHYPEVKQALQWLRRYHAAQLTGTGACVFSAFPDKTQANAVLKEAPREWTCFIAKSINHSPHKSLLRDSEETNGESNIIGV